MNGKEDVIELENALSHHQLTYDQFISMCVAAGCDYLKNIKIIGIYKAKQLVKKTIFLMSFKNINLLQPITEKPFYKQGVSFCTSWFTILKYRGYNLFVSGRRVKKCSKIKFVDSILSKHSH